MWEIIAAGPNPEPALADEGTQADCAVRATMLAEFKRNHSSVFPLDCQACGRLLGSVRVAADARQNPTSSATLRGSVCIASRGPVSNATLSPSPLHLLREVRVLVDARCITDAYLFSKDNIKTRSCNLEAVRSILDELELHPRIDQSRGCELEFQMHAARARGLAADPQST